VKQILILTIVSFMFLVQIVSASSTQKGPIETFASGCETELKSYCSDVVPGEGRLLACLYAHSDKVSGRCEYAVYDSAAQLERALSAISYVANECRTDLETFCADVSAGEGRLIECLEKNEAKVSQRCKKAFNDISE
jgi:hypothetical protein